MLGILLQSSNLQIIGYSNVSYESKVEAHYSYFTPAEGVHYSTEYDWGMGMWSIIMLPGSFEISSDDGTWFNATTYAGFAIFNTYDYPLGGSRGRVFIPLTWNPSGNLGTKTLSEWNTLQTDVTAGTKRNLVGTPIYG